MRAIGGFHHSYRIAREELDVSGQGGVHPSVHDPYDAATVILLRDTPLDAGVEILLVRRHADLVFGGGMLVFPGGQVADMDRTMPPSRWTGPSVEQWQQRLHVDDAGLALGLAVAAVRETFEEAGLLLAHREDGSALSTDDIHTPSMVAARRRLNERGHDWDWRGWLESEGLVLDLSTLEFRSWWITPRREPRRYDTRFFVATAPPRQTAQQDDIETTSVAWWRPEEVLKAHARGEVQMMYPTRSNLYEMLSYQRTQSAVSATRERTVDRCRIWPRR